MSTEYNEEEQQRKLIMKAIEHANASAGDNDADFIEKFRSKFFEEQSSVPGTQKRITGIPIIKANNNSPKPIERDRRFNRNGRGLTTITDRIVGGSVVRDKTFHDCVAVISGCGGCTGTLIAKNVVVTAGHCECDNGDASRVFVGNDTDKENEGKWINVAKQVPHPQPVKNDLMLLVLESEITDVQPRKIAPSDMIDKATNARVVGFGNTNSAGTLGYGLKRQVDVPIVSNSCQGHPDLQDSLEKLSDQEYYACHPGTELVAGKPLLDLNTCRGDSGGPLYISDGEGDWLLAGATSRGTANSSRPCGDGGIYVRVDKYLDWIREIAGI